MTPTKIITIEKSRYLEQRADEGGLTYSQMMENAGRAVASAIEHRLGVRDRQIVVLVGPGNNGGDGLVAAHYLWHMGARVTCYVWRHGADTNYTRVLTAGMPVIAAEDDGAYLELRRLVAEADVVVDALLGVGVDRPIGGVLKAILDVTREACRADLSPHGLEGTGACGMPPRGPAVVAVDCPTGLNCDTGALDASALAADLTVTFAHSKVGLLRFPGAEAVGDLVVADIGIPPHLADDVALELATAGLIRGLLPPRPRSAHKGTFGRALIVAGSVHYVGAAVLAGMAATRVGTGLVTMALPTSIQPAVAAHLLEATYLLLPHDLGVISSAAVDVVRDNLDGYQAVLVGPGLTHEDETTAFVRALLGLTQAEGRGRIGFLSGSAREEPRETDFPPLVIDADGLNALATADRWWTGLPEDTILTPHPGEMARLMGSGTTTGDVQSDREGVARRMAMDWSAVIVLKGAFTVVAAPDGRVTVVPFANPGLATAGTGDVLAGAIVGLRAQGLGAFEAALAGAYLHGLAGELARADLGDMGMVAGDVAVRLPLAVRRIREGV